MGKQLATRDEKVATVRGLLEKSKNQLAMALPKHLTAERFMRLAMTSFQRNADLLACTPQSLIGAIMESAQLGLEIGGVLGHAYLVPYKLKGGTVVAQFIPGYRGLVDLARRSGCVSTISATCVYEGEYFTYSKGLELKLEHRPDLSGKKRGKLTFVYAICVLRDGGKEFDVMSRDDVERIRQRAPSPNKGPWVSDYDEMAKKTVLRRLSKLLPMSVETQRAFEIDEPNYDGPQDLGGMFDPDPIPDDDDNQEGPGDDDGDQTPESERREDAAGDSTPVTGKVEDVLAEAQKQIAAATSTGDLKKIDDFFQRDDVARLCQARAEEIRASRGERSNKPTTA